ncbi:MAG: type II/IV secretion system protein [Lachnospiraceae bacterium]|nr:type II/IV secretion system protein [Lachnospiraceae bacterium]
MAINRRRLRLGDLLINQGIITEEQLQKGLELQKEKGCKLGEALVESNVVAEETIVKILGEQLRLAYVDLSNAKIEDEILELVPSALLKKHMMIPFEYAEDNPNVIRVAMVDPLDIEAVDDINIVTNLQVETVITTRRSLNMALDKYFGQKEVYSAVDEYAKEKEAKLEESEELYNEDVNSSPIVQLVKSMIEQAVRQRASDIHIEPMERQVRIRYRIDGALYERMVYSQRLLSAIVARIKIIGGMDISEKRKPQDGRITQVVDRQEYDIRASVLPTVYGEKVVMRLTSKNALTLEKRRLGLNDEELEQFDHILQNPHGILLVTGPTGSGKSTTLYTALSELNKEDVNIITVEDPVEANIDGINQVQVNPKADLTFASALRSILRQDPDIIMIGEIRDSETAQIAVQASITGHLVVSTLHTNSAASTVTRLSDMGIEPYLIADSVVGIIAQRLVRRLCGDCKEEYEATVEEKELLGYSVAEPLKLYKPCGCDKCDNTGYKGRIGVYEIMEVTPQLKRVIAHNEDADKIKNVALENGMKTLRMRAAEYVIDGTTSVTEMLKVSFDS